MKDKLFNLKGRVVLITGASGQLGYTYLKAFLERNAIVIALDISKSKKITELENKYKENLLFINADITIKASLIRSLNKIKKRFGALDVLINNAAIDSPPGAPAEETGPFDKYPEKSWDKVIDVNLKGTFLTCQIFGSFMANKGSGSIINVSSIYGLVSPDQSLYEYRRKNGEEFYKPVAYSASKSGVLNLTRYLASYWAKDNVRVNSLTIAGVFNKQDKDFLNEYTNRIPIGRMANANEYNGALIFLASDASSYMTGSNLILDGGWTSI